MLIWNEPVLICSSQIQVHNYLHDNLDYKYNSMLFHYSYNDHHSNTEYQYNLFVIAHSEFQCKSMDKCIDNR